MSCSEWKEYSLSDLISIKHGYAFKGKYFSEDETDLILLTPGNFKIGGGFQSKKFKYYSLSGEIPEQYILKKDDLLVTMTDLSKDGDTLGYPLKVPVLEGKILLHNQRLGRVTVNSNLIDKNYLYYLMCSDKYRNEVLSSATGTTVKHTAPDRILKFKFKLPPLKEQKKIANILSSLDDKIELNNEMNKTLEEMAQSIFKRWFVDFEFPNDDGQPYKSSGGEMVESELGMIPKGWEVKTIADIGNVISGGTPSTKNEEYYGGNISWITPKDLSGYDRKFISKGERSITELGLQKSSAKLLPKGTVLFSSRAPIGYVAISNQEVCTNQGFKSIVCNTEIINNNYVYYFLKLNKENIENISSGSTFKEISGTHMKNLKIIVPEKDILDNFNKLIISYNELLSKNYEEIDSLMEARDILLPKLMNGEIIL